MARPPRPRASTSTWTLALGLVVVLTLTGAAVVGLLRTSPARPDEPERHQVTWSSGVFPANGIDTSAAQAFGAWRGNPVEVAVLYYRSRELDPAGPRDLSVERYRGFPGRLSIGVPLTFEGTPLAEVARGDHDAAFRSWARHVAALGRKSVDLRLGWEFNGDWQPWSAFDPRTFNGAFRHVAQVLKSVLPGSTIDWTGNRGASQAGHDPFSSLYPGDDVVDVIGLDAYDNAPGIDSRATFSRWAGGYHSLDDWSAFAKRHGKKFAVPEWGLTSDGGGDNPAYIEGMYDWFSRHSQDLAFEAYFNQTKGGTRNSLHDPVDMPAASAVYRRLWARDGLGAVGLR